VSNRDRRVLRPARFWRTLRHLAARRAVVVTSRDEDKERQKARDAPERHDHLRSYETPKRRLPLIVGWGRSVTKRRSVAHWHTSVPARSGIGRAQREPRYTPTTRHELAVFEHVAFGERDDRAVRWVREGVELIHGQVQESHDETSDRQAVRDDENALGLFAL